MMYHAPSFFSGMMPLLNAFPLDPLGFGVYTFLLGGCESQCPFSTRLRVLKLRKYQEGRSTPRLRANFSKSARSSAVSCVGRSTFTCAKRLPLPSPRKRG